MHKLLSVIIPVYNGEKTIIRLLKCLWKQSYEELEIVIVNDGSSDRSDEIIRKQIAILEGKKKDSRSFVYISRKNAGAAAARNAGIMVSSGEYLTFADQDDYILPEYCEQYMRTAEESFPDIVIGGYERVAEDGKILRTQRLSEGSFAPYVVMGPWAHIYKRSFLLENQLCFLNTGIGEDVYFNLLALGYAGQVKVIDNIDYKWMYNEESVSNTIQKKAGGTADPLVLLNSVADKKEQCPGLNNELCEYFMARYVCWYILFSYKQSEKKNIRQAKQKLHLWLEEYYPDYRKNKYLHFKRPKGESRQIAFCVWIYYNFLEKLPFLF